MKKLLVGLLAVAVFVVIGAFAVGGYITQSYDDMVKLSESTDAQWGQVENVYQRRNDLIPNLVKVAERYAKHEKETFQAVAEARSKVGQIRLSPDQLTPENMEKFQMVQGELSSALSRLMMITENNPNLKADTMFIGLMDELAGSENRIAVERRNYNDMANANNIYIKGFFKRLVAGYFGFKPKPLFKAEEGAKKAPVVNFQ